MRKLFLFVLLLLLVGVQVRPAAADDIAMYGGMGVDIKPNVLIILDNSGSMNTDDVPETPYDPSTTYSGSFATNEVYAQTYYWFWSYWSPFANSVSDIGCTPMKNDLTQYGYAQGDLLSSAPYSCSNSSGNLKTLRTGNFLNYVNQSSTLFNTRISVAKTVIKNLITNTPDVRFGLMVFNSSENDGGRLVAPCGTDTTTLLNDVTNMTANTWTPLGETLAEAGLYFAGQPSWYNDYSGESFYQNGHYVSPIQYRCQKNYVIIVTDGAPTYDDDSRLASGAYINGDIIGDYNNDGLDPGDYSDHGSDYLDDVADYLHNEDVDPTLGAVGDPYQKQTITTFTIGFQTSNDLLRRTAKYGGGQYFSATAYSTLSEAFNHIVSTIQERNALFVAPVVPVDQTNKAYAGDKVYLGFFRPEVGGRWSGNVKGYYLDSNGNLVDVNGQPVVDSNGNLLPGSQSRWSTVVDGPDVKKGGIGEMLAQQDQPSPDLRNIYTYLGTSDDLTAASNAFTDANTALTSSLLGLSSTATAADRSTLIADVRGDGLSWPLGDIIHSQPLVIHYDGTTPKTYIFVGANDGMLHVFDDADTSGKEVWGFVPPGELSNLPNLEGSVHTYFVDGSPAYYDLGSQKVLIFGERRGGDHYYALDITDPLSPKWLYEIDNQKLVTATGSTLATLGESWSTPQPEVLNNNGSKEDVFLIAGGYDLDEDPPTGTTTTTTTTTTADAVGKAIYTIDAATGDLSGLDVNAYNWPAMQNCITDVAGFDMDGDGYLDRVYAGDLGGKILALRNDTGSTTATWDKRVLFQVPDTYTNSSGTTYTLGKKFMYAPTVTKETNGEYVFAGTGDRADPTNTSYTDAIYAIQNDWQKDSTGSYPTFSTSDLVDVSNDTLQSSTATATAKASVSTALQNGKGWFFVLPNPGEKVVSSPVVFDKVVYFTTYTPASTTSTAGDPCTTNASMGTARLYAVNYDTGEAAYDFSSTSPSRLKSDSTATAADRSLTIGTSIPSAPNIVVLPSGARLLVGVQGGVKNTSANETYSFHPYFWMQLK